MKNKKDTTIYTCDKGPGFAVLSEQNSMWKIEEQLGEAKIENDLILKSPTKSRKYYAN